MSGQKRKTAVITVVGEDRVGIIAAVSTLLADAQINIEDISQTILQKVFTMIMLVDLTSCPRDIKAIGQELAALGETLGITIRIQHHDIFSEMHHV